MANIPVSEMRAAVESAYTGHRWKVKVADMPDCQIIALYYKFLREGKIDDGYSVKKAGTDNRKEKKRQEFKPYIGEQMKFEGLS